MSLRDTLLKQLGRIASRFLGSMEKTLKAIPGVNQRIEKEYDGMMEELESSVKPYKGKFTAFTEIPEQGRDRADILREIGIRQEARARKDWAEADRIRNGLLEAGILLEDKPDRTD